MLKKTTTVAALLGAVIAIQAPATAAIVTLKNGDRITGNIVSHDDGNLVIVTEYMGTITVPAAEATVELSAEEQTATGAEPAATVAAAEAVPQTAAQEEAVQTEKDLTMFDEFMYGVQSGIQSVIPEGWSGRFSLGYQYTQTNSKSTTWAIGAVANKDSGDHHYSFNAFYDYKQSVNQAGVVDKQLDKWGGGFKYRWDFGENFFFLANTAYLRDQVKEIRHEITQDIGVGYYFYNTADTVLYVAPAFTPQYKDAVGVGKKWYYLATVLQEFKYKLNSTVSFEQSAQASVEPGDDHNYNYKAKIAVITKLTDWIDLIFSYSYSYDNTVGSGASKREQIATVSLGIPF